MKNLVTPKQVAQAINISESSVKRWCDRGLLSTIRTAGGHRRLAVNDVLQFLRTSGQQLVRPELLGLPSNTGQGATVVARARKQLVLALLAGDEDQCRRIVFDLYLGGQLAYEICDRIIAPAMHEIGDRWECGKVPIYQERRALETGLKALQELRMAMKAPPADAPRAIGGTLEFDPYRLPTSMIELVLCELGWQATSLGSQLPTSTLAEAVRDIRPKLLWVSVSCIESVPEFLEEYALLYRAAVETGATVVVGGRALTAETRREMAYTTYCDTLRHLVTFASSMPLPDMQSNSHGASLGSKA